jgi:uncharacterized RDD family membrane protein YckC
MRWHSRTRNEHLPVVIADNPNARREVDMTIKSTFDFDLLDLADQSPGQRIIIGFWRRLLAFILDGQLLGLVGIVLGLLLFDPLARLGGWGRLLGFCVAIVYFGVLNSSIAGGQNIGKRIMKIRVVDRSGHSISPGRSFVRYAVLGAPFFLNHLFIPLSATFSPIGVLIGFILFGFGGAIFYLFIFNRRTRQSLHDLVVGTFVIRTTPPGQVVGAIWRPHLIVVGVCFVVVIGLHVATIKLSRQGVFPGLIKVARGIEATGNVHMAEVFVFKAESTVSCKRKHATYIRTKAVWKEPPVDIEKAATPVASIVLRDYPEAMDMDAIVVNITYGYNIGLASAWIGRSINRSPSEWAATLAKPPNQRGVQPKRQAARLD